MSIVAPSATNTWAPTTGPWAPTLIETMAEEIGRIAKEAGLDDLGDIDNEITLMAQHSISDARPTRNIFEVTLVDPASRPRNRPARFSDWSQPKKLRVTTFKRNGKLTNKQAYKMLWCTEKLSKSTFRPAEPQKLEDCDHVCFSTAEYDGIDWLSGSDTDDLCISDLY
jgi:hypothetical protein